MKKIHAAAAAFLLAAFVLCGCSASGRVSTAKDGIIRDERDGVYTEDGTLSDATEKDSRTDTRKDTGTDFSAGTAETGR